MTMRVLFNGTPLTRPGGASRIDASAFQGAGLSGIGIVGLVGEADGGEPNVINIFTDPNKARAYFRSGALADAAALAFAPMKDNRVPAGAAAVACIRVNQATRASKALLNGVTTVLNIRAKDFGSHTNRISVNVTNSGNGKIIEIKFVDGSKVSKETSPVLGATAEFQIQYTGSGTACSMTIDATGLHTTVTNGSAGDNLTLLYSDFDTLQDLITFIGNHPSYTATAVTRNPYTIKASDLDYVTGIDVRTAATSLYAKLYRVQEWVTLNSALVDAVLPSPVVTKAAPDALGAASLLTGGTRGTSSNTNWQAGLDLLKRIRVHQVVPLISADLAGEGKGSTATFVASGINAEQHATYMTSTAGKSERHAYIGMAGTKSSVLDYATQSLQSYNACLLAQKPTVVGANNALIELPEWGLAVIAAGARAGSNLGEPLTWKYLNIYGISQDASWNPMDDGSDMILGGVLIVEKTDQGYRFVKGVTTYTREDNDAFTEESVVQGWKYASFEFRSHLENLFTGRRMAFSNVSGVKQAAESKLSALRDGGVIVDSVIDGVVTKAYRAITVSGTKDQLNVGAVISPAEGINFILNSLYLQPASFSV